MPRSTHAGRGELAGPAPTARQVRQVTLVVSSPVPGVLLLQQPEIGLVASARTRDQVVDAINQAFCEAQCAAYSLWRQVPTVRRTTLVASVEPRRRADVYDADEWAPDPDRPGVWVSPSGRRYQETSRAVQAVLKKRGQG